LYASRNKKFGSNILDKYIMLAFILLAILTMFNEIYFLLFRDVTVSGWFFQLAQTVIFIIQSFILFKQVKQTEISSRQQIPVIVLNHSETKYSGSDDKLVEVAIINVRNLTENLAFYVKLEEMVAKHGKRIDEILRNVNCDIVGYLGPREEREMCHIADLRKFVEVVDLVKISYLDVYGDWHETMFRVSSKEDRLIFMPIPQNILKQKSVEKK